MIISKHLGNKQNGKEHFYVHEDVSITKQIICLTNFQDLTKSTLCKSLIHRLTIIQDIVLSNRMAVCTFSLIYANCIDGHLKNPAGLFSDRHPGKIHLFSIVPLMPEITKELCALLPYTCLTCFF